MKITKREFGSLAKAVFNWCDEGKVIIEKHDDFLEWAFKALESLEEDPAKDVDIPVEFQGLFRTFTKSADYAPGIEEMTLQAEERANYKPSEQGPGDKKNMWMDV